MFKLCRHLFLPSRMQGPSVASFGNLVFDLARALLLAACTGQALAQAPVSAQLQGYWVPSEAACSSKLGVSVGARSLKFKNAGQHSEFRTETCLSCEGGARYAGHVIWVLPQPDQEMQFVLYLNADERLGVARIEFQSDALKAAFPLHHVELKRCAK